MTDKVHPSIDVEAEARKLAQGAIQLAGGSSDGWVIPSANDPGNLAADDADITEGNLDAFSESHSSNSFDVTISAGAGIAGGSWFARDTDTTVTLDSSTNNQDVYAGWDVSKSNQVLIGKSGAFNADDPKVKIWTFDTDGSGVTSSTSQRNTDNYRVKNEDVEFTQNLTGDETLNQHPLGSGDIATGAVDTDELAQAHILQNSNFAPGF